MKAKTQAIDQLRVLLVSAPPEIREQLPKAKADECVQGCANLRSSDRTPLLQALAATLRSLTKHWLALQREIKMLDALNNQMTSEHAKRLRAPFGVSPQTAATLIAAAGDNPERLRNEASLAALCGTSSLQASSGKTVRRPLNRRGDRAANNALWTIAMVRMHSARAYVAKRTQERLSNQDVIARGAALQDAFQVFHGFGAVRVALDWALVAALADRAAHVFLGWPGLRWCSSASSARTSSSASA